MAPRPPRLSGHPADLETQVFMISAAARSALEIAADALGLANERKPEVYDVSDAETLIVEGLWMEWRKSILWHSAENIIVLH